MLFINITSRENNSTYLVLHVNKTRRLILNCNWERDCIGTGGLPQKIEKEAWISDHCGIETVRSWDESAFN